MVNGSRDIRFPQNKGRKRSERLPNETEAIRTNAYQTEVQVKNYWLEYQLEKKKAQLPWDLRRVQLLESFIGPAAQFGVELEAHLGQLSIFDYDSFIHAHTNDSCDQTKVREWVYVSLFQKAVQDANGVALLRSKSLGSQAITLWRSLFETDVLCQYIGARLSNDHLACRYLIHSIVRPTILRWEAFNKNCLRLGQRQSSTHEEVERRKQVYKLVFNKDFGNSGGDYEWILDPKHKFFYHIAEATNCDMLFYRIANNEVHPTFGVAAILTDLSLPLPAVPLLPVANTLSLEYQTVRLLENTTRRASHYITLRSDLQGTIKTLLKLAEEVLRDLSQARA